MLTIDDLDDDLLVGIDIKPSDGDMAAGGVAEVRPQALVPDSTVAQALWRVWSGTPLTVIDSPPGGGKSESVATIVAHLVVRGGLKVTVAVPTRRAAVDIALRLAQQIPYERMQLKVSGLVAPAEVNTASGQLSGGHVTIRTLASCARSAPESDLLVVDEAYQCTFADVAAAANRSAQILMVGDPGQIGPVITIDTTVWDRMDNAPHRRAPEVMARRANCHVLSIPRSYRLGQATVDAIAPMYSFAFDSGRIPRRLVTAAGRGVRELESVLLPATGDVDDLSALGIVADLAASYIGATRIDGLPGGEQPTVIGPRDIAVVVSHNSQSSIVTGLLAARGAEGIAVGTADRLQGGQWTAVVALDPAFGYKEVSPHMLNLGRLCVMSSRATTSLLWVHDDSWRTLLTGPDIPPRTASVATQVRTALTARRITLRDALGSGAGQSAALAS